jgi:hypothetical protein
VDASDIVGIKEIAERLGRKPQTAALWRHRGILPPEEGIVSGAPAWHWRTIAGWAVATGRVDAVAEFAQPTSGWRVVDGVSVEIQPGAVVRQLSPPFPQELADGRTEQRIRLQGAWDNQWYEVPEASYRQGTGAASQDALTKLLLGAAVLAGVIILGGEAAKNVGA